MTGTTNGRPPRVSGSMLDSRRDIFNAEDTMTKYFFLGLALAVSTYLPAATAAAQGFQGQREGVRKFEVTQKGQINDGPLEGYSFSGTCVYSAERDALEVDARCHLSVAGPAGQMLRLSDTEARIAVVGGGQVVQLSLGPRLPTKKEARVPTLSAFTAVVIFGEPVTLGRRFPALLGASINFLGIPVSTSSSDCLIYDFVGPNT